MVKRMLWAINLKITIKSCCSRSILTHTNTKWEVTQKTMHNKSDNNNKCKQCANIIEEKNTVCLGASWKKPDEIRFKAQKHKMPLNTAFTSIQMTCKHTPTQRQKMRYNRFEPLCKSFLSFSQPYCVFVCKLKWIARILGISVFLQKIRYKMSNADLLHPGYSLTANRILFYIAGGDSITLTHTHPVTVWLNLMRTEIIIIIITIIIVL